MDQGSASSEDSLRPGGVTLDLNPAVSKFIDRATAKRGQYLSEVSFELNRIYPI